jgi:hypothetical protein
MWIWVIMLSGELAQDRGFGEAIGHGVENAL